MKTMVLLLTMISILSPAFADDYLYTNKDLEKYKMPPHNLPQPSASPGGNRAMQAKKVLPPRKTYHEQKRMHSVVSPKQRRKRIQYQGNVVVWPENVQTQ